MYVLDHISLGVANLQRAIKFYDIVLRTLGYDRLWSDSDAAGYGIPGTDEQFAIKQESVSLTPPSRLHIAFRAPHQPAVIAFYNAAVAAGATDDGRPELQPMYGPQYFAAFVRDLDDYRLEAVHHGGNTQV